MAHTRKPPVIDPSTDWGPWRSARFQTEVARDEFLRFVTDTRDDGWLAEALPDDALGAQVRWRPRRFLGLNDIAYAHGGRIVMESAGRR